MNIKPLYSSDSKVLVGLEDDFRELCVLDGLVMSIDLERKKIIREPWSGQKLLLEEDYTPILIKQKNTYRQKIRKAFRRKKIAEMEKQLRNPSEEAIKSLIWKPERLVKEY